MNTVHVSNYVKSSVATLDETFHFILFPSNIQPFVFSISLCSKISFIEHLYKFLPFYLFSRRSAMWGRSSSAMDLWKGHTCLLCNAVFISVFMNMSALVVLPKFH